MEKAAYNKKLGEFVNRKRKEKKLSQVDLAYKFGINYQYLSKLERGLVSPTVYWLRSLSQALEIPFCDFLCELEKSLFETTEL